MSDRPHVRLGEVARVRSGFAFKSSEWTKSGVPVVKISNVKSGSLVMDGCSYVSQVSATRAPKEFNLSERDILIAMTGYIGDVARTKATDLPAVLNQRVGKFFNIASDRLDDDYLYSFLSWSDTKSNIAAMGYGSAQPNVSPSLIENILIPLPPIHEQRAIAHILGTLDDKIELNRRMAATLEEMARAIFKSWFIDFDPVRAKAEGRPTNLPPEIDALIPEGLTPEGIPIGWKMRPLDSLGTFLNGLALQKYPPKTERTLPVIKIAQLRKMSTAGADRCGDNLPIDYVVEDGDILFSWSGSLECVVWTGGVGGLNQHLFKVTSNEVPDWFLYFAILEHLPWFRGIAASKATTMGHIQRKHLSEAAVCYNPDVVGALSDTIGPIYNRMWRLQLESRTLAEIRDSLLPKLISGELRVAIQEDND